MVAFQGRSAHTVKIKNKPVKEGFKLWVIAFEGYALDWLFHSAKCSAEQTVKSLVVDLMPPLMQAKLAPTFQVPYLLCKQLSNTVANAPVYLSSLTISFLMLLLPMLY